MRINFPLPKIFSTVNNNDARAARASQPNATSVLGWHTCGRDEITNHSAELRVSISKRTTEALERAKVGGKVLGLAGPKCVGRAQRVSELGKAAVRTEADRHAGNVSLIVNQLRASGFTTLRAIAVELNTRSVRTARGGAWHSTTVRNLLLRENTGGSSA